MKEFGETVQSYGKEVKWRLRALGYNSLDCLSLLASILWVANLVTLSVCAPILKKAHPRILGFRDIFIPLHIISALSSIPLWMILESSPPKENHRLSGLVGSILLFITTGLHLQYALQIHDNIDVFFDVKNLQNSNDTKVDFITTYYLAVFNGCCLFEGNEPTLLDCDSKDFEAPCFRDEDLFETFRNDFEVANEKCVTLTQFNPYNSYSSFEGFCETNEAELVSLLASKMYRRLLALTPITFLHGCFSLWFSAESFLWYSGPRLI